MRNPILVASLGILFVSCSCRHPHNTVVHCCQCGGQSKETTATNHTEQNADWQITARAKAAIMSDSALSGSTHFIHVETNNGIVTLTGKVHSPDESRHIERKVRDLGGVRQVNNQLTLNQ